MAKPLADFLPNFQTFLGMYHISFRLQKNSEGCHSSGGEPLRTFDAIHHFCTFSQILCLMDYLAVIYEI